MRQKRWTRTLKEASFLSDDFNKNHIHDELLTNHHGTVFMVRRGKDSQNSLYFRSVNDGDIRPEKIG